MLESHNYFHYGDKGKRDFFDKTYKYKGKKRFTHIHLTSKKEYEGDKMILLRDYLRENLSVAKKYDSLKRKAAKLSKGKREIYRDYKKDFVDYLNEKIGK